MRRPNALSLMVWGSGVLNPFYLISTFIVLQQLHAISFFQDHQITVSCGFFSSMADLRIKSTLFVNIKGDFQNKLFWCNISSFVLQIEPRCSYTEIGNNFINWHSAVTYRVKQYQQPPRNSFKTADMSV